MARDLEMNTKRYKERQKKNTEANERAEEQYEIIRKECPHLNLAQYINHQDKLKYRLWEESERMCLYSGKMINETDLWSPDIEIDHIFPHSRRLDNSHMNKVVCFATENQEKGNKTPWEAWKGTDKWKEILNRLNGLTKPKNSDYPRKKYKNIIEEKIDRDFFINSQLTDSRYIAKETGKYMRTLGCDITFTKGWITSWLRREWGLNNILGNTGKKNRRDHRHHAVDATVIALTSRSLYEKIVPLAPTPKHKIQVPPVLPDIRTKLKDKTDKMIVAHSTNRKVTGAFHEDTAYGLREENGKKGIVVRKNLTAITNVKNIICPVIKRGFKRYVCEQGGLQKAKKALKGKPFVHPKAGNIVRHVKVWKKKSSNSFNEDSYYIKKDENGKVLKIFLYGNIHHMEIIKNKNSKTEKIKGVAIPTMKAVRRLKISKEPVVRTNHGEDCEFLMSLCKDDMVSVERESGKKEFFRIRKIRQSGILFLRVHTDATPDKEFEKMSSEEKEKLELAKAPSKLITDYKMKKESVNALGQIITN